MEFKVTEPGVWLKNKEGADVPVKAGTVLKLSKKDLEKSNGEVPAWLVGKGHVHTASEAVVETTEGPEGDGKGADDDKPKPSSPPKPPAK